MFILAYNLTSLTTMKYLFTIIIFALLSCKKEVNPSAKSTLKHNYSAQELEEMVSEEANKFDQYLSTLYALQKTNPKKVIKKADSILATVNNNTCSFLMIDNHVTYSLDYLKAEIYYNMNQCDSSIAILNRNDYQSCHSALAIAANYTVLKNHEMARKYVDSINCYIADFALANYYETVGDKESALKIYRETKRHREWGHYKYYELTLKRIEELEKPNPKLLSTLHFITGDPSYDIAEDDNELRGKIFDLLDTLPECTGLERHIFRSPKTNDKDYYWIKVGKNIKVGHDYEPDYKAQYDFFIYAKDLSVKYYNPETKKLIPLEEWRKTRNTKK